MGSGSSTQNAKGIPISSRCIPNKPYFEFPGMKEATFIYIHNVPVIFTWIGATQKWDGKKEISMLTIQLNISSRKDFEEHVMNNKIFLIESNTPNTILFDYNGVTQNLKILKDCTFNLQCDPCVDRTQLFNSNTNFVGKVMGYSKTCDYGFDRFSCGNRGLPMVSDGGSVILAMKRKYSAL
jgi:hypothetical protein